MNIELDLNAKEFVKAMEGAAKQLPFAQALALTRTANDARHRVQKQLSGSFTIRSPWVERSIQTEKATKARLLATVGSISPFMVLHAEGGERKGKDSGDVAVPVGARPTPSTKTTVSKWPGKMLKKRRFFTQVVNGKLGVWKRTGRARYPIRLQWLLKPEAKIDATWPFEEQVKAAILASWRTHAQRAVEDALRTARR